MAIQKHIEQHTIQAHNIIYDQLDTMFRKETRYIRKEERCLFLNDHLERFKNRHHYLETRRTSEILLYSITMMCTTQELCTS
jgi:hypothetical protein